MLYIPPIKILTERRNMGESRGGSHDEEDLVLCVEAHHGLARSAVSAIEVGTQLNLNSNWENATSCHDAAMQAHV